MATVRQQIRDAATVVLTGLPTTGARAFKTRVYPLETSELPAVLINTNGEEAEALEMHANPTQRIELRLVVTALVRSNTNFDNTLDDVIGETRTALANAFIANRLSGLVHALNYTGVSDPEFNAQGDTVVGDVKINFDVTYFTRANAPETAN